MCGKLLLFLIGLTAVSSRRHNFYRKDYTYIEEYDAFYKLHWDMNGVNWNSAFLACDDEGAELFYPQSVNEWTVAKSLVQADPVTPNDTHIFVGIHDKFGLGEFITINGRPTSSPVETVDSGAADKCVTMDVGTGQLTAEECDIRDTIRPFVCKKVEDIGCPTIDKGYIYQKEINKCYKRNDKKKTWSDAMETCFMEGGILAVATSTIEADVLRRNFMDSDYYFAGFKRIFPNKEYYTVTGHKIRESGYEHWYNENIDENHDCGVFYTNGNERLYYYAQPCDIKLSFICEMNSS